MAPHHSQPVTAAQPTEDLLKMLMKYAILSLAVAVMVTDADATDKPQVEILTEKNHVSETGYDFEFKTSDGVARQEEGQLITVGDHQGIGVKGSYSYVAPDGDHYVVTFTADDKGYKPTLRIDNPQ